MAQGDAINTGVLDRNLAALRDVQPEVADQVEAASAEGVEQAVGRDGRVTFRVPDGSGRLHWMGHSSMPSISAAELFGGVRRDQGNVLLPGVLSGYEPLVIAGRLAPFAAVFVVEKCAGHLKLAMGLHDYADRIRDGRIVFLCGEHPGESLCNFFASNPGYEYPAHLFRAPHVCAAQSAAMQNAVEEAGQRVLNHHAALAQRLGDRIAAQVDRRRSAPTPGSPPRIALLSVEASDVSLAGAARVRNALRQLAWPHEACVPDSPRKCHIVARLAAIERSAADAVCFVNSAPRRSRALLPASLPVVSWYLPGSTPATGAAAGASPRDLFVASTPRQQRLLDGAGRTCLRVEPAADSSVFHPPPQASRRRTESPVVVLADLPADRAGDVNLSLTSQVALWDALRERARDAIARAAPVDKAQLLAAAESQSGTTLSDDGLREKFEALIDSVILPAAYARAATAALQNTSRAMEVYGYGWDREDAADKWHRGPVPDLRSLCGLFHRAAAVVLPVASEIALQTALEALACAVPVVLRGDPQQLRSNYPGLVDALEFIRTYRSNAELVRRLAHTDASRRAQQAAFVVGRRHSVACRLRDIVCRLETAPGSATTSRSSAFPCSTC